MKTDLRVASPPTTPVMVYDGDCNFCRRWVARWQRVTGDRVEYFPFQDAGIAERFPEIPREALEQSIHFVETTGQVSSGAEAAFRAQAQEPRRRWLLRAYESVPGLATVSECAYRVVARNRNAFSALTLLLWGSQVGPSTHVLTRWLFLRLLGVVYLIAFVSLWSQLSGLVGSNGIFPANETMKVVREQVAQQNIGLARYRLVPTLCWFSATDGFLQFQAAGGTALAVLLILGIAPMPVASLLWLTYLSLSVVGREFLSFQWDALLLETGLLAIFFAPLQLLPRWSRQAAPSRVALWMLRLLLFKLMFASGVVKLTSGDPTWRNLTALNYHYETQPLPTWTAWYAHQLPEWFQKFSCGAMFGIELAAPFLICAPRRLRFVAGGALVFLQLLIIATGNYSFFNWLSILLCVPLFDDMALQRILPRRWRAMETASEALRWPRWITVPVAAVILSISLMLLIGAFRVRVPWPASLARLYGWVAPLRSVNSYGLFALMTTSRPEIIVEGSMDGLEWKAYEFKYKPGDPSRRPRFVAPHQPRLDWQMWFAALGNLQGNPWFLNFCIRLLEGSPSILALLRDNPFPNTPPRYLRAMVYDYHFTDLATRRSEGTWWTRELTRPYCPIMTMQPQ